jgi:hypothetical protein
MRSSVPGPVGRGLALAATLFLLFVASAPASAIFGPLQGPDAVRPGARVSYWAHGLLPSRQIGLTIQPSFCVGSNGCAVGVKGSWESDPTGAVRLGFHFPRHYDLGCTAVGCESFPHFRKGSHAEVQVCIEGATEVGETGFECDVKTVLVRGHRRAGGGDS